MGKQDKAGSERLVGLVAATHTPFARDGSLALEVLPRQAEYLLAQGIETVFIGGSTGESQSLTLLERIQLAERWAEVVKGTKLRLVVHVGANCVEDASELAARAERLKAAAVSALAPSYFKPRDVPALVETMARIAGAAPETPFYYYDIPQLTGLNLSVPLFIEQASQRIPNLAGVKFSGPDLMAYQQALRAAGGACDIPYGMDECLLAALALGARGAVGSSYNFAARIYQRLWLAFEQGDLAAAQAEQYRSVQLIQTLASFGYMAAAKALMARLGVPVGQPRLPLAGLDDTQREQLFSRLESLGCFGWIEG